MSGRNSDSRRRRLLQIGLIADSVNPQNIRDHRSDSADDSMEPPGPAEMAARSLLGASQSENLPAATRVSKQASVARRPVAACGAGLATIQSLLAGKEPLTWVFTGDNVTQGAFYTNGQRGCVEIFAERLRAELRRSMDVVINTGISGDTAANALSTIRWRTLRFQPDVVILSLGLNDAKAGLAGRARFEQQMRELLDQVRTQGAIPLLILPHPVCTSSNSKSNRDALPAYVQTLQEVAVRDEVPIVDHWNFWLRNWPSHLATRKRLQDGRLHLNAESHRQLARLIFETLGIFDPESSVCRTDGHLQAALR